VPARGGHLQRALDVLLPSNLGHVGKVLGLGVGLEIIRAAHVRRDEQQPVQVHDELPQALHGDDG